MSSFEDVPSLEAIQAIFRAAAHGQFPPADGVVEIHPSLPGKVDAVLGFTGHHVIATNVDKEDIRKALDTQDLGAAMRASFLTWLGERLRTTPGMLDVVLACSAEISGESIELVARADLGSHPRVARALRYREEVRVYSDYTRHGLLVMGRGLAGRWELSVEVSPSLRGRGLGGRLIAAAGHLLPPGEPIFAQVAAGNAASLRAFLAAGFRPIGAEVLFLRPQLQASEVGLEGVDHRQLEVPDVAGLG